VLNNDLAARFGRDAAHAEWFYGFRLAIKTGLGSQVVRAWSIVSAAVNEREVAIDLLQAGPPPRDLLTGKGFNGKTFTAHLAGQGAALLVPTPVSHRGGLAAACPARRRPSGRRARLLGLGRGG
jgi:hypothetical protein